MYYNITTYKLSVSYVEHIVLHVVVGSLQLLINGVNFHPNSSL